MEGVKNFQNVINIIRKTIGSTVGMKQDQIAPWMVWLS